MLSAFHRKFYFLLLPVYSRYDRKEKWHIQLINEKGKEVHICGFLFTLSYKMLTLANIYADKSMMLKRVIFGVYKNKEWHLHFYHDSVIVLIYNKIPVLSTKHGKRNF